jgi:hypothetical protein
LVGWDTLLIMSAVPQATSDVFNNVTPDAPASMKNPAHVMRSMFSYDNTGKQKEVGYGGLVIEQGLESLDHFRGHDNVSTGLAYNIRGRATRIEVGVGDALATYQDPIKALFGTRICGGQNVVITRKYVVGGKAVATPERAPARVVKVQEDVRTVQLTRYGADLEMNLNLFLKPADAQYELDLKLGAQKQALENELTKLGYEAIMKDGIRLQDAIVRSQGGASNSTSTNNYAALKVHAERVYRESVFGAFQRHEFPLQNLVAAAKNASVYRNVVGPGSVMILPHASPDLISWTKPCHMEYNISGLSQAAKKDVTMTLDSVYEEPMVGLKIMVHHPPASNQFGSTQKVRGESPLTRKVKIYGKTQGAGMINFSTGKNHEDVKGSGEYWMQSFYMSSAIIGVPGAETGELLVGYPFTSVSTNQRTESMTVGLRVYLGAVLKQLENVIVLPDVHFDGCAGEPVKLADADAVVAAMTTDGCKKDNGTPVDGAWVDANVGKWSFITRDPATSLKGTTILGELDSYDHCAAVSGLQVYRPRTVHTKTSR